MTLKENLTYNNLTSSKLEKIADEFAIGFAEWANENYFNLNSYDKKITLQKALEIYKKEKEL
jgi:hypothetical protein